MSNAAEPRKSTEYQMAKRIKRRAEEKPKKGAVARPDWVEFRSGYHGQGTHRDKSKYTRKDKHKGTRNDE
jgi:hypothetical protein